MGKHRRFSSWILVFIGTALLFYAIMPFGELTAQDENTGRRQFYNIAKLVKIIEDARKAGFSDEELKKLELRDGDQVINIMDYMEELERIRKLKDQRLQEFLNKRFLTVKDIYNELIAAEPEVIKKLREELVSER